MDPQAHIHSQPAGTRKGPFMAPGAHVPFGAARQEA